MVHLKFMYCRYVLYLLFLMEPAKAGFFVGKLPAMNELRRQQGQPAETEPSNGNSNGRHLVNIRGGIISNKMTKLQIKRNRSKPNPSQYYYLLNSLETWKSIMFASCILLIFQKASSLFKGMHILCKLPFQLRVSKFQQLWSFSLPLLSSSCCAIQLALNTIAGVGCAGFNTTLGPLRPLFISILLMTTINSFRAGMQMNQIILSWAVSLMPEFVHFINIRSERNEQSRQREVESSTVSSQEDVIELDIKGMGCVACINKIDRVLRISDTIIEASSWLNEDSKGGKARVAFRYPNEKMKRSIVADIMDSIKDAGFDCRLK